MTQNELGWAAGFWEGEGSCNFYETQRKRGEKIYRSKRLYVTVTQIDKTPLVRLKRLFGGSISKQLNNVANRYGWKCRPIYRWAVGNELARNFTKAIVQYVVGRRKQQQLKSAIKRDQTWIKGRWANH